MASKGGAHENVEGGKEEGIKIAAHVKSFWLHYSGAAVTTR